MNRLMFRLCALAAIPLTWLVIFLCLFFGWHAWSKQPVAAPLPTHYPIVVLADGRARIVWAGRLAQFKEAHPDYSFLVPLERTEELRDTLEADTRSRQRPVRFEPESDTPWSASFEVSQRGPGRQAYRVDATFDDDRENVGWYEATEREIYPQYHRFYFGPGRAMLVALVSGVLTLVAIGIAASAKDVIRRPRRTSKT